MNRIYVAGDAPTTAQQLLELGVPADRIAGHSCARTTWENATLTTAWIRQHLQGSFKILAGIHCRLPPCHRQQRRDVVTHRL